MRTAIRIPAALTVFVIAAAVVMTAPAAVLAFPPTADAGGPYTIAEGEALTLDGSGSFDPDLDPITYEWNINLQGTWADVTGVSPTLTWAQLQSYSVDDDGSYQIVLRVTAGGEIDTHSAALTVGNTAPTLLVTGPSAIGEGVTFTLSLSSNDPGADAITSWKVNWGDGAIETIPGNPSQVSHLYVRAGYTYDVLVSATDEDGVWHQSELLVGSQDLDSVFRFAPNTGAFVQEFGMGSGLDHTRGLDIGPDGRLYVAGHFSSNVLRFESNTGAFVDEFVAAGAGGLGNPVGLTFGPDGHLYVSDHGSDKVIRYDGATGAFIDDFVTAGSGGLDDPAGITFGPDGRLYVTSEVAHSVLRYDGISGDFIDAFVPPGSGGLNQPYDLTFGPDGNLYVTSHGNGDIIRYDGTTGAFIDVFTTESGMGAGASLAFGPDGHLYGSFLFDDNIVRFDGTTGAEMNDYVAIGEGGLDSPVFLTFAPVQSVTVTPGAAPVVVSAIPDTAVAEDNGPIANFRDLNDVFFDAEDGSALEFAIVSNSNPSLITATIDADSALDLNIVPDSSGTATIVIRAADLSAQVATVSFTVTVTSVADDPVAEDDPGIYSDVVLSMNPLSYWRLGEGAGPAAADSGSIANDGTYSSVTLGGTGAITGDANTAPRFDGASSYVEIPHDDAYLLDNGSLQFWARFNANPPAREAFFSKDASGFVTGGHLSVFLETDGSLRVRLQSTTGDTYLSSNPLTTGQWHHVVVSFGILGMELYIDGNLVDTDPYTGGLGTTSGGTGNHEPAAIGANTWGSNTGSIFPLGQYFDGPIDEVAIFGEQLTLSQVQALRRAGIDHYQTDEETALNVPAVDGVLANDYDNDGDPLTAVHIAGPANAQSFTLNPDGSFSYSPAVEFIGTDTFTYQADDGSARSDTATVSIVVVDVNDPPRVIAALPDTAVAMDSAPIDNYRDLNDVFSDDEDGGALTFAVQDNSNPSLVTAAIDADSALDLSIAPGQGGFASLVIRATDSGALAVEDTMLIYVSAGVTVTAELLGAQTIHAGGAPIPMFSVAIANVSALAETLTAVRFTNTTSGPGTQTELDNEFSPLTMTAQGGVQLLAGGSSGPASASFTSGVLVYSGLISPIAPGDTLRLLVEGGASTAARDGDVLDFDLTDSAGVQFTWPLPASGAFPLAPPDSFVIDGMVAAQIALHPVTTGSFSSGSVDNLALDFTLPPNGYEADQLERLNIVNLGTAIDTVDVVAVKAWTDDGDGIFSPSQDPPLGEFSWTGARWERTGLSHPIPAGGTRVFVTVDIADNPHEGRSVRLALPSLPDVAVGMASGNDGPIDAAVENPVVQIISTDDRVVLSAAPVSGGSVSPGQRDVVLLQLTATNNYNLTKQMTRLTVANTSIPQGAATQDDLDREFDNLQLREDANDNGTLDDTATDPVVGTAVFVSGTASFTGLAWNLPALTSRNLFVTTGISLQDARDGDVLGAAVYGAYDVDFSDVTSVIADWPVKAVGQRTVDGMIAAQITLQNIAGVTLAPGDGPVLALDVVLPGNGYADDVLNALTVENAGTAVESDISEVRAWRDGGDNAFDAGAGDDVEIGQLFPSGNSWISSLLNEPLPATGTRVFVGITVGGTPTDSATVRLTIPIGGVVVATDNDGPIDFSAECGQTLLLSRAPLLASIDAQPVTSTVGQNVTVSMTVENVGGEQINNITPNPLVTDGGATFGVQSGPQPVSVDLAVGASATFTWVLTSTTAGDATWRATVGGIGSPSGLQRSSLESSSNLHRVFDQAIGVELFPIESMPFLISRGQTGVVPLSLTFVAPGGAGVSQARIRALRLRVEDGQGGGIVPSSLLSRVVVSEGNTIYSDKTTLETGGSEIDLTLSTPAVIPAQEPVTLSIRLDILATTVVPEFRIVLIDSTRITADDAISGAPVTVSVPQGSWPVASGLGRVTAPPTEMDVEVVATPDGSAGWGQKDVEVITLRLTNPGVAGVTSDAATASIRVGLVDDSGTPVSTPSAVFERLRVRGPMGTYYTDYYLDLRDTVTFDVVLSPLLKVDATTPADLTILADIAGSAPVGAYRLRVVDQSSFDARDVNTGASLPVVFASDPLPGRLVTVEATAESLLVTGTAAFQPTVMVGEADVGAMTLTLRHPAPGGTGRIRIDAITFRCQNEVRNPLVPATYVSRVAVLHNSTVVGTPVSIPTSGDRVVVPVTGVTLQPGETVGLEVFVDIATAAPMSFFEMTVEASGGIDAFDDNVGSPVVVSGTLPATSGLTQLMPPPSELVVSLQNYMPAALVPGAQDAGAAAVTLFNTATAGSGPITLDYLIVRAADGGKRAVSIGDAVALVEARIGGGFAGRSDSLTTDSTTAYLPLSSPLVIQPQQTVELELLIDYDSSPRVNTIRFGIDATGVGIRQPASAALQIDVEPAAGGSFPLWTKAGTFNQRSLAESYSNYPNPFAAGGESTRFVYYLPDDATVSLVIWTTRGERVTTLRENVSRTAGLHQDDVWDGRNGRGSTVVNGVYIAELRVSYRGGGSDRLLRKVAVVR